MPCRCLLIKFISVKNKDIYPDSKVWPIVVIYKTSFVKGYHTYMDSQFMIRFITHNSILHCLNICMYVGICRKTLNDVLQFDFSLDEQQVILSVLNEQ